MDFGKLTKKVQQDFDKLKNNLKKDLVSMKTTNFLVDQKVKVNIREGILF